MKKRILMVSDVSAGKVLGGAERMLVNHVRALAASEHELTLLTRQPEPETPLIVELADEIIEHRLRFSGDKGPRGLMQLAQEARLWWQKHAGAFDCVVAEQPFVIWALLRAGCRLPRLQVCYSFAFQEYATRHGLDWGLRHRVVTMAMRKLESGIYRSASSLFVLSEHTQREFKAFFAIPEDRVTVVPGGVDLPIKASGKERDQYRAELGWDKPVVLTLRNLVPRTGVDMMIQAAAMLRPQMPELRWCVIGGGALNESLRWLARQLKVDDIIELTGYLAEGEVLKRMQSADVFMLPTRSLEGFGLVTIEANACGLPVVATPVGANPEVVKSCRWNRLAEESTPEALADALSAMFRNSRGEQPKIADQLREHAANHFSWDRHDRLFLDSVNTVA